MKLGRRIVETTRPTGLARVIALVFLLIMTSLAQAAFTIIGVAPGEPRSAAQGISPDGTAVVGGTEANPTVNGTAWLWTAASGLQSLGSGVALETSNLTSMTQTLQGYEIAGNDATNGGVFIRYFAASMTSSKIDLDQYFNTFDPFQVADGRFIFLTGVVHAGTVFDPIENRVVAYRQVFVLGNNITDFIGPLSGDGDSQATDMSEERDVVVGNSGDWTGSQIANRRPFIYSDGVGLQEIPVTGTAEAVSADGSTVVGEREIVNANGTSFEAYRRTTAGVENLGCVGSTAPIPCGAVLNGASFSEALDTSGPGLVVVGFSHTLVFPTVNFSTGFWWFDGVMYRLDDLLVAQGEDLQGFQTTRATAVSDDGLTIAGFGVNLATLRSEAFVATLDPLALAAQGIAYDSDGDRQPDPLDNCTFVANGPNNFSTAGPAQNDTNGDGFGNMCDADLDNSGFVNFGDLAAFKAAFGTSGPDADLDGSGFVNFSDLARFKALFGQLPGPSCCPVP